MKLFFFLLLAFLTMSCAPPAKLPTEKVYFDEDGNSISRSEFDEKWRNDEYNLALWQHIEDGKRVNSLSSPLYKRYSLDYLPLLRNLEKITGQEFPDNTVLVIGYTFKDDLCSSFSSNSWHKRKINSRKSFLNPLRDTVLNASDEVAYVELFEEGIKLKNNPGSPKEYFFKDRKNFFRKHIFKDPTTCGSYVLIKPNGQALVRNGEYRPDWLVSLLHPEYWNLFFPL